VIAAIEPGSPAARAGLAPGDVVVRVDGEELRDIIDWRWLADGQRVDLVVLRGGLTADTLVIVRARGESWGVEFTEVVFDGVRTCRNRCAFCFMAQLPKGLRRALYLRDDDFRLSFLQGNFITLTNLSDADVDRIIEQRLTPLYVSLHATDPAAREQLICAQEDRALERFDELLRGGIDVHVQIVLVPGINDGDVLDASLRWLAEREGVESVGIVPLGLTAHQTRFSASYEDASAAAAVIDQVAPWQTAFRERDGITWVYLADEFYLNANVAVPEASHYDGFPHYENGIGLVRGWIDDAAALKDDLASAAAALDTPVVLITGTLFAPVLSATIASLDAEQRALVSVLPVQNRFLGGSVSVTGLLAGEDLASAISSVPGDTIVLVPDIVGNADGLLLDGVPASELGIRMGRDVRLVSCDAAGLLGGLREAAASPHTLKE
jgi:putative radical SAM enzyme (TIGR03279 family)